MLAYIGRDCRKKKQSEFNQYPIDSNTAPPFTSSFYGNRKTKFLWGLESGNEETKIADS
jgi:hypothetical protein